MNFIGKNIGDESGQRRQQQKLGGDGVGANSFEEEDEEEKQITSSTGQLFTSPSSSSPSSHHLQPPSFHPQHSFHNHHTSRGWMHGGEPSSRVNDPMMVDYSSIPGATPAPDNNNNNSNSNSNNNNNNNTENHDEQQTSGGMMMMVEREHMFDKVVTPSDVGKLNRLVIPKQHAERYFPLDSSSNEKGLLLNFEDRNGKPWRFRYSYWNSSQSYVMTKGWSRFVKDKKLDAGDIVSFQRGVGGSAKDRLFIDWRHRPDAPAPPYHLSSNLAFPLSHHQFSLNRNNIHPWNPLFLQSQPAAPSRNHSNLMLPPPSYRYGNTSNPYHNIGTGSVVNVNQGGSGLGLGSGSGSGSGSVIYFRSGGGSGIPTQQHHVDMIQMHQRNVIGMGIGMDPPAPQPPTPSALVYESVPVVHGKAAAKRLRLFGVNMDCPISDDDDQDYDPPSEMSPTMVSSSTPIIPNSIENYHHDHFSNHYPPTSSSSTIPYLQLRPYEEESHFHQTATMSSSTSDALNKTTKSSSSRMTLDLDF